MKIEVSTGELIDKITILEIKLSNVSNDEKRKNVENELNILNNFLNEIDVEKIERLQNRLKDINKQLWDIEDKIRIKEKEKAFDSEFIELARSVYFTNDRRAALKREIDVATGSNIINEKEYEKYE